VAAELSDAYVEVAAEKSIVDDAAEPSEPSPESSVEEL
jgi:hypothetical protein